MTRATQPDNLRVRAYMDQRTHAEHDDPPPSIEEIRRMLG